MQGGDLVAVDLRIQTVGIERTLQKLSEYPEKVQRRALRLAVSAGGTVLVRAVKANSPRLTGLFRRSIAAKVKSYQGGAVVVAIAGQTSQVRSRKKLGPGRGGISGRGEVVPIHFLERDIKPHRIGVRRSRALILLIDGEVLAFRKSAMHPGHRGYRMVERAAAQAGGEAQARVEEKLREEVEKLEA